jgi:GAF domain-containing protein
VGGRGIPALDQDTEIGRVVRERDQALEQLSSASEILKIISSSPGDLKPVFQAMLANAVRLCQAKFGVLWLAEGDRFRSVALHDPPPSFRQAREREPLVQFGPHSGSGRAIRTKRVIHIADLMNDQGYLKRDRRLVGLVETGGARAAVFTPLVKDNEVIGTLVLFRQNVGPFTDKQIALVQNFAAQAVIAIENTRLLNELRQSLEQQTATADVLRVISSSPGELEAVFQTMLANATRLCEANFGVLQLYEDGGLRVVAMHNPPPAFAEIRRREPVLHPGPLTAPARVVATKQLLHITDLAQEAAYREGDPGAVRFVETAGARTLLMVPMLKEDALVGTISIYRQEVRSFTDKQIELVQNFAAQAVIAIENTRLLNDLNKLNQELEQRRRDRAHEQAAPFPAAASRRFNRRVWNGKAAGKPSPGDNRALLRSARFYRLLGKLGPGRRYGPATRVPCGHRRDHHKVQRHA